MKKDAKGKGGGHGGSHGDSDDDKSHRTGPDPGKGGMELQIQGMSPGTQKTPPDLLSTRERANLLTRARMLPVSPQVPLVPATPPLL